MYNATQLKAGLLSLVGWRQNPDPDGWQLSDLTTSDSGLFFNDEHPLLTMANLISIAPPFERLEAAPLDQEAAFEAWLQEKTEAGIIRAIQAWIDRKFEVKTAGNLLERKQLFEVTGNGADTDPNEGKFVFWEFTPRRSRGLRLKINEIALQLTENQSLTLYLFKSGTKAPVQSTTFDYTGAGGVQWKTVDWELTGEGSYYVGYFQSNLTGNAIRGVGDFNFKNAGYTHYPWGRYFEAVAASAVVTGGAILWDVADNVYSLSTNYGLNFRLNVQCDYTAFILEQKDLFKTLIAKQVAVDLLREFAYNSNTRVNRHESNFNPTQILYEIDGDTQGRPGGLQRQLEKAIETITFDTKGLDRHCLPCRKRSVNYRAI